MWKLEEELEEIDTLRKIDIFDYDNIRNEFLLEDIRKYGKQIYWLKLPCAFFEKRDAQGSFKFVSKFCL